MRNTIEHSRQPLGPLRLVTQEHPLGCAVACVAARCGITYIRALGLFSARENAWLRGYHCEEIVEALARAGLEYCFESFALDRHALALEREGTIIFVGPCADYPAGHYLVRAHDGWMNSWANYPLIRPAAAAYQVSPPGRVDWIIFEGEPPAVDRPPERIKQVK